MKFQQCHCASVGRYAHLYRRGNKNPNDIHTRFTFCLFEITVIEVYRWHFRVLGMCFSANNCKFAALKSTARSKLSSWMEIVCDVWCITSMCAEYNIICSISASFASIFFIPPACRIHRPLPSFHLYLTLELVLLFPYSFLFHFCFISRSPHSFAHFTIRCEWRWDLCGW